MSLCRLAALACAKYAQLSFTLTVEGGLELRALHKSSVSCSTFLKELRARARRCSPTYGSARALDKKLVQIAESVLCFRYLTLGQSSEEARCGMTNPTQLTYLGFRACLQPLASCALSS